MFFGMQFLCHSNCAPDSVSGNTRKTSTTPPFILTAFFSLHSYCILITAVDTLFFHVTCSNAVLILLFCCVFLDSIRRKPGEKHIMSIKVLA